MIKNKPRNTNGVRSIQLLMDALLILLEKKKLVDISISGLTKAAGLVRNTFYAHFETKEDLLSHCMFSLFEERLATELEVYGTDNLDLLYFKIWNENKDFLNLLMDNDLFHLLNRFSDYFDRYLDGVYDEVACDFSDIALPFVNDIYADVLASIVKNWMKYDRQNSPEELCQVFRELVK